MTAPNYSPLHKYTSRELMRMRPGMYVGSTDQRGLHNLIYELVDNSVNEALDGTADRIDVVIATNGTVMIRDNGSGIPVEIEPEEQKPVLEVVMTILHARDKLGRSRPKTLSGLHGTGAAAVNALSEYLRVEVRREGKVYAQEYKQGVPQGPVAAVGEDPTGRGTTTVFKAAPTIFETTDYDQSDLVEHFRKLCYLTKGLTIHFVDERIGQQSEEIFYFPDGICSWVEHLNRDRSVPHAPFYVSRISKGTNVEVALQYNDSDTETILTFVNNTRTFWGGTHLTGFRAALTRTLNTYAHKTSICKDDEQSLTGSDVRAGLTAIVSVMVLDPWFASATTDILGNAEVRGQVQSVVGSALMHFLKENPHDARKIIEKCLATARARVARRPRRKALRNHDSADIEHAN